MRRQIAGIVLVGTLLLTGCSASAVGSGLSSAVNTAGNGTGTVQTAAAQAPARNPITREQAEAIALEHAGFTADQVTRLRTEYEVDDGVLRYEVQFRQGRWEYDYEINTNTGEILSWDRDD